MAMAVSIPTSISTLCDCRLVNAYGDKHNHELLQYQETCELVARVAAKNGRKIILLGNVVFGGSCLDALVIGDFGIVILEYKSYGEAGIIRIDGQKQFHCLDNYGKSLKDENGGQLIVKGGSFSNPVEQAKVNYKNVSNLLKKVFGETVVVKIPRKLAIVFPGKKRIEGLDHIEQEVSEWLNVIGSDKLFDLLDFFLKENRNRLSEEQVKLLIDHISANKNVLENVDIFRQAKDLFNINSYKEALYLLKKCDATRPEVRELMLRINYKIGESRDFQKNATAALQSENTSLRIRANELLGLASYYGTNGIAVNLENAVEYLEATASVFDYSKLINEIKDIIVSKRISKLRDEANKRNKESSKSLLSHAIDPYKEGSRIASSALWIVVSAFALSMLIPGIWEWRGIVLSVIGVGIMVYALYKGMWDADRWFIRKEPQEYTSLLNLSIVEVDDRFISFKFPRLKVFACGLIILAMIIAVFILVFLIVKAVLSTGIANDMAVSVYKYSGVNILYWIPFFMVVYFILTMKPFIYSLWNNISAYGASMTSETLKSYYVIAIPGVLSQKKYGFSVAWSISFMTIKFSVALTVFLSVLGVAKPVLYKLILFLLESV